MTMLEGPGLDRLVLLEPVPDDCLDGCGDCPGCWTRDADAEEHAAMVAEGWTGP